jgi:hypothetical protein
LTPAIGQGPAAGDGPHRYAFLLFAEPANFEQPSNFTNTEGTPITQNGHWNVTDYVRETGLQGPFAAALFTVENGQPSAGVSVVSASAINTASVSSEAAASASPTTSGSSVSSSPSAKSSGGASASSSISPKVAFAGGLLGTLVFAAASLMI